MLAMKHNGERTYGADDFKKDTESLGVDYTEEKFNYSDLNRSSFVQNGKLTQAGGDYLAYLFRKPIDEKTEGELLPWLATLPDEAFTLPGLVLKITKTRD